ncbi:MAG: hypothetical protein Q8934_11760 [Bacillota bacterium]|nr:hypothetical protein [Bacillota bacterium]
MSFPTIPNVTPTISINREEVFNLLLASIAFEELGLAHIINAEAEKIQAVVGTLPGVSIPISGIPDLILIDNTVEKTLKTVIKNEMLLQFKLEDIVDQLTCPIFLTSRTIVSSIPGSSEQIFHGTALGTNQVRVEILTDGNIHSSTIANVDNNHQFTTSLLNVPEGLPPEIQVTVRVISIDQGCEIEQLVSSVPAII